MHSSTICAISTPPGTGGIAVARVSGPQAIAIADKIWRGRLLASAQSHTAHLGTVLDDEGQPLDQAVATVFRAPASFTGQDVVEISIHGSAYAQQALIQSLIAAGAQMAAPGEFTRRAFAAGKLDLAQAEAVADIIASQDRASHRIAISHMRGQYSSRLRALRDQLLELASLLELELDFSEEDVEFASRPRLRQLAADISAEVRRLASSFRAGSAIKQGIPVAIVGPTNAGKSSILNALLGDDRAIVSDIHGTTRDVVEDRLHIGGFTFRIMDTAGLRRTSDQIEALGIERSRRAAASASIIISVTDATAPAAANPADAASRVPSVDPADAASSAPSVDSADVVSNFVDAEANPDAHVISVLNKADLLPATPAAPAGAICTSAATGLGIDALRQALADIAAASAGGDDQVLVTSARHYQALLLASESIDRAIQALDLALSGDLVAQDIRLTIHHLSSILGDITAPDILASIFSRFCIGK